MDNLVVPSALSDIMPILHLADEVEPISGRVAYLCRMHALDKAHRQDPLSSARGVHQFKTALIHHLRGENATTLRGRTETDARDMQAFYRAALTKAYRSAAVLFEVLKAASLEESIEVPNEILEADARVSENVQMYAHNIPPVEPESSDQALVRHREMKRPNDLKIPLEAIKKCTQDFDERNFIGKGGYGSVYMGILSWGDHVNQIVAVKRLDVTGFQGNKEFHTELTMLSQYHHENIITLIGFCDDNNEMILVYEYASHGSLDAYLRDTNTSGRPSWPQLLKICIGVVSALDYLHNFVAKKT